MLLHIEEIEVELTCKVKKFISCRRVGPSEQWGPAIDDSRRVEEDVEYMCEYTHIYSYLSMLFVLHNHCYVVAGLFTNMHQQTLENLVEPIVIIESCRYHRDSIDIW